MSVPTTHHPQPASPAGRLTTILAIESSCDETACAIVQKKGNEEFVTVISETTATSLNKHIETKGIVPEVAAREQLKSILPVIEQTIQKAAQTQSIKESQLVENIDAIAITTGPGLIGSLLVGVETAKTLAMAWNKPLIPVNHVMAHPYANFVREIPNSNNQVPNDFKLPPNPQSLPSEFPLLSWVISGGHTDLYYMESHQKITRLGGTVDDSAGECFDKCARVLGFDYPGGPNIEKLSIQGVESQLSRSDFVGTESEVTLPRPMLHSKNFNLSFSGLKTAFARKVVELEMNSQPASPAGRLTTHNLPRRQAGSQLLAEELQQAITDVIVKKTQLALEKYPDTKGVIISGGVSANKFLSTSLQELVSSIQSPTSFSSPPLKWCTDNAVMIGSYALFHPELTMQWQNIQVKL